jgi:hypothetical protein
MCGRTITVPEFDLLFPGINKGIYNENLAYCCCNGWTSMTNDDWSVTFEATLESIKDSFKEALTEVIGRYYQDGKEQKLSGDDLEMYVISRMPGTVELLEDFEPLVLQ